MAHNNDPKNEPSSRRLETSVDVKPAKAAKDKSKDVTQARHFDNETLAKAPGTSGPSTRHTGAVQVKTALTKGNLKGKHIALETLAKAPGTSGPSTRHTETVDVQPNRRKTS
jgi:hypothetical protein